jgi:hypothetical protein
MKNIFALAFVSLLASCGNPHISSEKSGLERTSPPIETTCDATTVDVTDYSFFVGSDAPLDYVNFVKCRRVTREDFNIFPDGSVPEISNDGRVDHPYVLTHRSEVHHDPDKVNHFGDIFGTTTYNISVQNPVGNNGASGVDRGVSSGSVESSAKDALVWKFATPISFWSARPVGIKNNSTLRIFNCSEELLNEREVAAGSTFVGFISAFENVCYISLSSADGSDSIAVDDFEYGN